MSENIYVNINVQNNTAGVLTLSANSLSWGKWGTNPVTQIAPGQKMCCTAEGAKGTATGTEGYITYTLPDNQTYATISFDIPYSGSNSGGLTVSGGSPSQYWANETDSTYINIVSFPSGGSPTTYFEIAIPPWPTPSPSFGATLLERVAELRSNVTSSPIDIVSTAWKISCGSVPPTKLVEAFAGKTSATAIDIIECDLFSVTERIHFVTTAGVLSPKVGFEASLEFAASTLSALAGHPEVLAAAKKQLSSLRELLDGSNSTFPLEDYCRPLLAYRAEVIGQGKSPQAASELVAIDTVLSLVQMDPVALVAYTASAARAQHAVDSSARAQVAASQLDTLRRLVQS